MESDPGDHAAGPDDSDRHHHHQVLFEEGKVEPEQRAAEVGNPRHRRSACLPIPEVDLVDPLDHHHEVGNLPQLVRVDDECCLDSEETALHQTWPECQQRERCSSA